MPDSLMLLRHLCLGPTRWTPAFKVPPTGHHNLRPNRYRRTGDKGRGQVDLLLECEGSFERTLLLLRLPSASALSEDGAREVQAARCAGPQRGCRASEPHSASTRTTA